MSPFIELEVKMTELKLYVLDRSYSGTIMTVAANETEARKYLFEELEKAKNKQPNAFAKTEASDDPVNFIKCLNYVPNKLKEYPITDGLVLATQGD